MTNDFSACRTGDCRRLIRRVVIDHDDTIDVLEYPTHNRPDKACLTESRNNRTNTLPGRLNHLLTSCLPQSRPGYDAGDRVQMRMWVLRRNRAQLSAGRI